jgi:predicted transcriptional regulator of viral defense system
MNVLEQFGIIPVSSGALISVLRNYNSPNDKISNLEKKGELIRLKKGLYVVSPDVHRQVLSIELIANHLYGPSYISFERALSFYKLIPERVYTTRSMTIKRARSFTTPLGNFDYVSAKADYYSIGINSEIINDKLAYLVASPEKAICDMLVATPGLRLQSVKAMQVYLEEDLRIDFSAIETYNTDVIRQCIEVGKKKTELMQLLKFLQQ